MMGWFKAWRERRRRDRILAICRRDGHWLVKRGEGREHDPVTRKPLGPAELWVMGCLCGYCEVTDINTVPYRRSYEEGERLKKEQSNGA